MRDPYRDCGPDIEVLAKSAGTMELFEMVARGELTSRQAADVMMVQRAAERYRMGWLERLICDVSCWAFGKGET